MIIDKWENNTLFLELLAETDNLDNDEVDDTTKTPLERPLEANGSNKRSGKITSKLWRQEFFSTEKISTELFPTEHFPTEVIPTRVFLYRGYTYTEVKPTTQYSYRVFIYTTFFIHTILHTEVIPTRKFFRKNLS